MSELRIYTKLISVGLTPEGAAAMLGNIWAESLCRAIQKQGDLKDPNRWASKEYMRKVDSGEISRYDFAHDHIGWGLIQWTFWSRKFGLYDLAKNREVSIGDEEMQSDYLIIELKQYHDLFNFLCTTDEMWTACDRICREFEQPAVNNYQDRRDYADAVYARCINSKPEIPSKPHKTNEQVAQEVLEGKWGNNMDRRNRLTTAGYDFWAVQKIVNNLVAERDKPKYWPPRELKNGMEGHDVAVLQALLIAHGFSCNVRGIYDTITASEVSKFQASHDLPQTGNTDNETWRKLVDLNG